MSLTSVIPSNGYSDRAVSLVSVPCYLPGRTGSPLPASRSPVRQPRPSALSRCQGRLPRLSRVTSSIPSSSAGAVQPVVGTFGPRSEFSSTGPLSLRASPRLYCRDSVRRLRARQCRCRNSVNGVYASKVLSDPFVSTGSASTDVDGQGSSPSYRFRGGRRRTTVTANFVIRPSHPPFLRATHRGRAALPLGCRSYFNGSVGIRS